MIRVLKRCMVCETNPVQIRETDMCAPCTFGDAETLGEFDPVTYAEREVPVEERLAASEEGKK